MYLRFNVIFILPLVKLYHQDKKKKTSTQSLIHSANLVPVTAVPQCKLHASQTSVHSLIHSHSVSDKHMIWN